MVELQLDRIEKQLRRHARATMWWRVVLLALVGLAFQLAVWTSSAATAPRLAGALPPAALGAIAIVASIRRARRPPALIERLRQDPRALRGLTLHWVTTWGGTRGQLGFEFRDGASWYVPLPTETARLAFRTLRAAYPWTRPQARASAAVGGQPCVPGSHTTL